MNGEKCDVEQGEKYCAEECEEDQCPPEGEHCPVTPHYNWAQDEQQASVQLLTARDEEAVEKGLIPTKGLPMSDTLYQVIDRENKQRLLELMFDPERWMWTQTGMGQMGVSSLANSLGGAAEASFACGVGTIQGRLVNVADDKQGTGHSGGGRGDAGKAVQVVQKIYKEIFLPMAFLLLLPGAILTQVKGMVGAVIAGADEDSINPFTGIIRAVIAVFLIVCTPLIVSYCIDAGNALAEEVVKPERGWVQEKVVTNWAKEQTFNPSPEKVNNAILVSGKGTHTSDEGQEQGSGGQQQGHGGSANVIVNVGP